MFWKFWVSNSGRGGRRERRANLPVKILGPYQSVYRDDVSRCFYCLCYSKWLLPLTLRALWITTYFYMHTWTVCRAGYSVSLVKSYLVRRQQTILTHWMVYEERALDWNVLQFLFLAPILFTLNKALLSHQAKQYGFYHFFSDDILLCIFQRDMKTFTSRI